MGGPLRINTSVSICSLYGPKVIKSCSLSDSQKIEDYIFPSLSNPNVNLEKQFVQVHENKYKCKRDGEFSGFVLGVGAQLVEGGPSFNAID